MTKSSGSEGNGQSSDPGSRNKGKTTGQDRQVPQDNGKEKERAGDGEKGIKQKEPDGQGKAGKEKKEAGGKQAKQDPGLELNQQPAAPQAGQAAAQPSAQETQVNEEMAAKIKEIENALFAIKFYPVAVKEETKNESMEKLARTYETENETIRQLLLYRIHENLAASQELRIVHTYDYFKAKTPTLDPSQLRLNVYRAMFNYNTSLDGLAELIRLLGKLKGNDDAAKVLTYHFARLGNQENETNQMLRAAIIDALGKSESQYALKALLEYAKYSDNERTLGRIANALMEWDEKIEKMKIPEKEKTKLRSRLQEIMTREMGGSHYG